MGLVVPVLYFCFVLCIYFDVSNKAAKIKKKINKQNNYFSFANNYPTSAKRSINYFWLWMAKAEMDCNLKKLVLINLCRCSKGNYMLPKISNI